MPITLKSSALTGDALRIASSALLVALKLKDRGTHDHVLRVARVSVLIGRELKLERAELLALYYGAQLHDIGKICTKDSVLKKEGELTAIERMHMRAHVIEGTAALAELEMPVHIVDIVGQHHERFDGHGYPCGLAGAGITLGARIVAVADAYDAITNNRCYRAGKGYQAAAAALTRCSGSQFDPRVVQAFFRIPEEKLPCAGN
jgi:putative nucleotidyltransferase with HDIG domain